MGSSETRGEGSLRSRRGRRVERGPVGSRRGRGRRDLGRERGVVDIVEFGGWTERRRVTAQFLLLQSLVIA